MADLETGDRLAADGDLDAAEREYRDAAHAGDGDAAAKLGLLLEHRGRRSEALETYRQADEQGSGYGAFRAGLLLSTAGDWDSAQAAWRRAEERGRTPAGVDLEALLDPHSDRGRAAGGAPGPMGEAARGMLASPVLVGAIAVLVLVIAVFLAYNSNAGLPFVPTRQLNVVMSDGSDLVVGNDVREGGFRVGLVSDLKPQRMTNGQVGALATLKLDQAHGKVPVNLRVEIVNRNVLGLKDVEITVGHSQRVFADGAMMPIAQTSVPVQFDDIFKTFDPKTRTAIQKSLAGSGDVLAGRGASLNDTIAGLPSLLAHLQPVARYLADPSSGLTRFLNDANVFVTALEPVVGTNIRLFDEAATTFQAISSSPADLAATIAETPSTLSTGTASLKAQMPLLVDLTTFGNNVTPAAQALRESLPDINPAIEAGTRTLARTPSLNHELQGVMEALKNLALAPGTNIAVNALSDTADTLNPMLRYIGPYQTVCDYWDYWWTFLSEHISQPTNYGFSQRALLNLAAPGTNSVQQIGAVAPVNGESGSDALPLSLLGGSQHLHSQNYGAAIDTAGNADCEVGQRGYPQQLTADPQHRQIVTDAHTPGDQGPTYKGRSRVPAGETFSRNPQTGPATGG